MAVLFTKAKQKGHYERAVNRVAALCTSLFGSNKEATANAMLALAPTAEGDTVAFCKEGGKPELAAHAKGLQLGAVADIVGEHRLGFKLEKHDGESVAVDLTVPQAVAVAAWLINRATSLTNTSS